MSAAPIYAETLPAAVVTAEGWKPAKFRVTAECERCPTVYVLPYGVYCSECGLCSDCGTSQRNVRHFNLLFKTNMLYDAALTPNIGLEIGLGKGWSIGGNVMYGWWTDRNRFYWRAFAADIGVRKYFGGRGLRRDDGRNNLTGHHIGLYGGIMTYDFEFGGRGYICDWREKWGHYAGIDYGYSLPVAKNLNIDFTIGLGYAGGRYKEYLPDPSGFPAQWHYVWQSTNNMHYFGPTRLEISLVWVLDFARRRK